MKQPFTIQYYAGKPVEEMTREELIKALTDTALKLQVVLEENINRGR